MDKTFVCGTNASHSLVTEYSILNELLCAPFVKILLMGGVGGRVLVGFYGGKIFCFEHTTLVLVLLSLREF